MKNRPYLAAALLLLVAHASAAAQKAETWEKVAPPADDFTVLMPTRPQQQTQTNPEDARMKMNIYTSEAEGRFFYVSSLNFSGLFRSSPENFEAFVKGFLPSFCAEARQRNLTCETTRDRDLTLSGHRGRQYKVAITGGGQKFDGVLRIYMTTKHFYALQALGAGEGDASVDKFLGSFAVTTAARP